MNPNQVEAALGLAEKTRIAAHALREAAEEVERRSEPAIADQHGGYVDGYRAASEAIAKMLREEALPRFPHRYEPSDACFVCGDPSDHRRHRVDVEPDDTTRTCPRCGSPEWVSISLDQGYTRRAQCVPCGAIHRDALGPRVAVGLPAR